MTDIMRALALLERGFWTAAGAGILSLAIYGIKTVRRFTHAYNDALRALSHDALYRQCRIMLHNGNVIKEELDNLEHLYRGYHQLGMNGTGKELYERCKELPLADTKINDRR